MVDTVKVSGHQIANSSGAVATIYWWLTGNHKGLSPVFVKSQARSTHEQ